MSRITTSTEVTIESWNDFLLWSSALLPGATPRPKKWIFRGEDRADYTLASTIEREARTLGIRTSELPSLEGRLMREFRRHLHHYTQHIPDPLDFVELLAVMQHYGAPTRLLDWTYSPFVAAYFAVEKARGRKCAIRALDFSRITAEATTNQIAAELVDRDFGDVCAENRVSPPIDPSKAPQHKLVSYLFRHPTRCVVAVNPFRLNERLTIQQGVFIMPGDLSLTFQTNLTSTSESPADVVRATIILDRDLRREFLLNLFRMNLSRATLFPGLPGYAESLQARLAISQTLSG